MALLVWVGHFYTLFFGKENEKLEPPSKLFKNSWNSMKGLVESFFPGSKDQRVLEQQENSFVHFSRVHHQVKLCTLFYDHLFIGLM